MGLSDNELGIILLNSNLGLGTSDVTPLTQSEWSGLFNKLIDNNEEPEIIFSDDLEPSFKLIYFILEN